jgi:hypothetical protein
MLKNIMYMVILIQLCGNFIAVGQSGKFYYEYGKKVYVTPLESKLMIYTKELMNKEKGFKAKLNSLNPSYDVKVEGANHLSIDLKNKDSKFEKERIKNQFSEVEHIGNAWNSSKGGEIVVGNEFHASLKQDFTEEDLIELNNKYNVEIALKIELNNTLYTLRFNWNKNRDVFDYCVEYFETDMFRYVTPDILIHKTP